MGGGYVVPPEEAGFARRLGALIIDWFILFLLLMPTAMVAGAVDSATSIPTRWIDVGYFSAFAFLVLAYFATGYRLGATLGMAMTSIRLRDVVTGNAPKWPRAIIRGGLAFVFVASWFVVFNVFIFSDVRLDGRSTVDWVVDYGALTLFFLSVLARLWLTLDTRHQTLIDHLLGQTVTVKKEVQSFEAATRAG